MSKAQLRSAFTALSSLQLWMKIQSGASLTLADIPGIIPLRYTYFRDNWEFIKEDLLGAVTEAEDSNRLKDDIEAMSKLIEVQRSSLNKTVNPFSKSSILTDYLALWQNIQIDSLQTNKEEQKIIDTENEKVSAYIKTDFRNLSKIMRNARDELSDEVGGSDVDYNNAFKRSSTVQLRDINIDDVQNMNEIQNGIRSIDYILANSASLITTTTIDPFALARANANNPNLNIESGKSGRLVRMNFGDSLQTLADRFLGDADRWSEIAIANGLRPPFVDEIGRKVLLLSNGSGNQINISVTDTEGNPNIEKFYIGQVVFLSSSTVKFPEQRNIISIKEIPISGEIVLELDGPNNLDLYKVSETAVIRVYLPNTINSNFLVMIPTPLPPNAQIGETPFFLNSKSEDEKKAGIDLSINDAFDLVFTPVSDLQISFGLVNAVQAIKIKMVSEKGQNARHSDFGIASVMGAKIDNPEEIRQVISTSITDMIEADNRFDRVENLSIIRSDTNFLINLEVRMAGTGTVVPISFTVNTG